MVGSYVSTTPITMNDTSLSGLETFDFVVVVAYVLVTLGIVYRASQNQHDTDDYFLGNRRMPWMAVGLSIMATLLSSLTYLSVTGEVIKSGIAAFMTQLAIIPAAPLVLFLFIPFFMRLRFTSAYEYLEHRFDLRCRLLGGGLFFLLRLLWVSMVMYSGSIALATMGGWNFYVTIAVLGVAATIYTYYGGLEGVVWTDVLQSLMLFGGALAIVLYVWMDTGAGPVTWWHAAGERSGQTQTPIFSFDPTVRMTMVTAVVSGFFWQICTHSSDQVVLQRYASTPSLAAAQGSYLTNLVALLSITSLLAMSGLALYYFYFVLHPERLPAGATINTVGDKLMPHFYATQLPLGFGGLILANFLCDAMQTLVSGVNSITAVATQDVLQHSAMAREGVPSKLGVARKLTLALGGLTTLIALAVAYLSAQSGRNIFDLMPKTFNMFIGPLGSLFLMGMFLPRVTGKTALPAVLSAVGVSVIWNYWKAILSIPAVWAVASRWFKEPFDLSIMWSYGVACVSGLIFAVVFSLLFERGGNHPGTQYTWWAVMKRPLLTPEA